MSRALVNLMMSRALVLVAVKATFGASLALGFLAAPHGVAALRGQAELRQVLWVAPEVLSPAVHGACGLVRLTMLL